MFSGVRACGRQTRSYKQRVLHEAIQADNYLKVEELVTSHDGLDVSTDQCALELAVSTGKSCIVQLLIQSGCCVGASNDVQFRALDIAIYKRMNDIVEILLSAGFDIAARNGFSESRLHVAACGNNDVILQRLLDEGFDPDETTFSWTACHVLAARNHLRTLKVLLRFGCDVDVRNKDGSTPIMLAVERHRLGPSTLLLRAGCDPRCLARLLKLTSDADNDEEVLEALLRAVTSPGPRPDPPQPQYAKALRNLAAVVRRRVFQEPLSLKDLTKFAIRRAIGRDIEKRVTLLPIPPSLQTIVTNIFPESDDSSCEDLTYD